MVTHNAENVHICGTNFLLLLAPCSYCKISTMDCNPKFCSWCGLFLIKANTSQLVKGIFGWHTVCPFMEEKTTRLCWLKTPSPYLVTNSRYHLYEWNYLWLVKHLLPLREWIVVSGLWCGTKFYFCYFYNDIVDISLERGTLECLLICQGSLYYKLYFGKKIM